MKVQAGRAATFAAFVMHPVSLRMVHISLYILGIDLLPPSLLQSEYLTRSTRPREGRPPPSRSCMLIIEAKHALISQESSKFKDQMTFTVKDARKVTTKWQIMRMKSAERQQHIG